MIRDTLVITAAMVAAIPAFASEADVGQEKFQTLCMTCHKLDRGPNMLAPPIFGVKDHYIRVHPGKDEFVSNMAAWLEKPDPAKSLMPGALRRFGVMPQQVLTPEERKAVAAFIYDVDFTKPGWYQEHFEQEHGKQ
ncbi:MAG: cytochrome c [Candidatus Sedimenticola sp. 20ELBAFRAG]